MLKKFESKDGNKYNFHVRLGSSDEKAIKEVCMDRGYEKKGFKINSGEKWIDLGVNCGAFMVFAAKRGARVMGFEPDNGNMIMAKKNIEANALNLKLFQKCVVQDSFKGETIEFFSNLEPGRFWRNSAVLKPKRLSVMKSNVPVLRFSELKQFGYNCLKVDIEGSEIDIFGEKPDISWVKKLALEWSFDYKPEIALLEDCLEYLRANFKNVYCDKRWKPEEKVWKHFPMNAMVFCTND